jgi:hypothetical protein
MALFVLGMNCSISGQQILTVDDAVMFPAFVSNEFDPIYPFSDAVIKLDVFQNHPLSKIVLSRYKDFEEKTKPKARYCFICKNLIDDPENYFALGYLVDEPDHALYRYNYAHFHRACLATWTELPNLVEAIKVLQTSGKWKGMSLIKLLSVLAP